MPRTIEGQADWEMNERVPRGFSFENLMKGKSLGARKENNAALNEGPLEEGLLKD